MRKISRPASAFAALGVIAIVVGGCSSSSKPATAPAPEATTTTVAAAGTARIVSFVVPESAQCTVSKVSVPISYEVSGAARQELAIDGREIPLDAAGATVNEDVHCDGIPHTIALIAFDAKGARTSQVKMLTTKLPA